MKAVIVLTNLPSRQEAISLAKVLVESRAAACVNIMSPCFSIYHWQEKTESTEEYPVLVKTSLEKYSVVENLILRHHPYELPEIIQVPITDGLPAYLDWILKETE